MIHSPDEYCSYIVLASFDCSLNWKFILSVSTQEHAGIVVYQELGNFDEILCSSYVQWTVVKNIFNILQINTFVTQKLQKSANLG